MGRGDCPRTGPATGCDLSMSDGWKAEALEEIECLKPRWVARFGWAPSVRNEEEHIDLFVRVMRRRCSEDVFLLRLRYEPDYKTAGRREAFVNPDNLEEEGLEFWPDGVRGFKRHEGKQKPPMICLEGTWGFHSNLHRDRDGRTASLNRLLMEVQGCMDE